MGCLFGWALIFYWLGFFCLFTENGFACAKIIVLLLRIGSYAMDTTVENTTQPSYTNEE